MQKVQEKKDISAIQRKNTVEDWFIRLTAPDVEELVIPITMDILYPYYDEGLALGQVSKKLSDMNDLKLEEMAKEAAEKEAARLIEEAAVKKAETLEAWVVELGDFASEHYNVILKSTDLEYFYDAGMTVEDAGYALTELLEEERREKDEAQARAKAEQEKAAAEEVPVPAPVAAVVTPVPKPVQVKKEVPVLKDAKGQNLMVHLPDDVRRIVNFIKTFEAKGWSTRRIESGLVVLKDEQIMEHVLRDVPGLLRFCDAIGIEHDMHRIQINEKPTVRPWLAYNELMKEFVLCMDPSRIRYTLERSVIHIYMPAEFRLIRKQMGERNLWKVVSNAFIFYEKQMGTIKPYPITIADFGKLVKKHGLTDILEEDGGLIPIADAVVQKQRIFTILVVEPDETKTMYFLPITVANIDTAQTLFQTIRKKTPEDQLGIIKENRYSFTR